MMIFIIGGKGFVGSAFVRLCEARRKHCAVITKQNYDDFIGKRCNILINANGNSNKVLAQKNPLQDFDASVKTVRASLLDFNYDYYVYLSSCDVYPDCSSPATTLENEKITIVKQSTYGFHKFIAEQCVQHVASKWLIIRFGGLIGPHMKKSAVYDILHGGPLWLDPESELQFMHTDRAAEIVLGLLDKKVGNEVFNVCGRGVIKLRKIIELIRAHVTVQPGSPRVRYDVNIEKISKLFDIPETMNMVLEFVQLELNREQYGDNP
jgi:nucleoside-diphosphate-sugar epimerase